MSSLIAPPVLRPDAPHHRPLLLHSQIAAPATAFRRPLPRWPVCIAAALILARIVPAEELYHLDFQPPELGMYTTVFGSPSIEATIGPFEYALVFRARQGAPNPHIPTDLNYDQIGLSIDAVAPVYHIDFDIFTHGLGSSDYAYSIILDSVIIITFHGLFNDIQMYNSTDTIPFSDDRDYHCRIVADLSTKLVSLSIDNSHTITAPIEGPFWDSLGFRSIRFNMGPWKDGVVELPDSHVALDNIIVVAIPEPSIVSLSLLGLLVVAGRLVLDFRASSRMPARSATGLANSAGPKSPEP